MDNFKTDKKEEWYVIIPSLAHGVIPKTKKGVHYNDVLNKLESFDNLEDYESKCKELGIELEEDFK